MILQSIVSKKEDTQLCLRIKGRADIHADRVDIYNNCFLSSYSYMNLFDAGHWRRLTGISDYELKFTFKGEGIFRFFKCEDGEKCLADEKKLDSGDWKSESIYFRHDSDNGQFFFEIESGESFSFKNAAYLSCKENDGKQNGDSIKEHPQVNIALIVCTYNAARQISLNLDKIKNSLFFKKDDTDNRADYLYGRLSLYIIDNKKRLPRVYGSNLKIIHNENTGGTGGFTRGLFELSRSSEKHKTTHVLFMDDDVGLDMEALYRLYSLLYNLKPEYKENPIAGRMFDAKHKNIQYTAAEIWDKGYVKHIGYNLDMSAEENLSSLNCSDGAQYGGWWFSCVPYEYARDNAPLPFFLHCDDAEYGIKNGKTPIILNGIDVLHDTPGDKASAVIAYYDARNSMILNSAYGLATQEEMIELWKNRLSAFHEEGDADSIAMSLLAMKHFAQGPDWFFSVNGEKLHKRLKEKRFFEIKMYHLMLKLSYRLTWRMALLQNRRKMGEAIGLYKKST